MDFLAGVLGILMLWAVVAPYNFGAWLSKIWNSI